MRVLKLSPILAIFCFAIFCGSARSLTLDPVLVCEDELETPPYTYKIKNEAHPGNSKISGYSVAVLTEILEKNRLTHQLTLMPWARCQAEIAAGRQHMALNVTWNADRDRQYLFSRSYYTGHDYYYYSLGVFPDRLSVRTLAELRSKKLCGLTGYNYQAFGFPKDQIDLDARDHQQLMLKLSFGQCDIFIEKHEIMSGFGLIGKDWLNHFDLGYAPIPEHPPTRFHMLIQPGEPGLALKGLIDRGLDELEASGRLAALHRQFVPMRP